MRDPHLLAAIECADDHHGLITQNRAFHDLIEGHFEPTITVADAFEGSILGLGVAANLDGEIVSVGNDVWRVPADGVPVRADRQLGLPFAIAAFGGESVQWELSHGSIMESWPALIHEVLDDHVSDPLHMIAAVQIDGDFTDVVLRSEHSQQPPYGTLEEALHHEVQFPFASWSGTLVGFFFPAVNDADVIPGLHLHAISTDRKSGGHCHQATVKNATITVWLEDARIREA